MRKSIVKYILLPFVAAYFILSGGGCKDSSNTPPKPIIQKTLEDKVKKQSKDKWFVVKDVDEIDDNLANNLEEEIEAKANIKVWDPFEKKYFKFETKQDLDNLIHWGRLLYQETKEHKKGQVAILDNFVFAWFNYVRNENDLINRRTNLRIENHDYIISDKCYQNLLKNDDLWCPNPEGKRKRKDLVEKFWNNSIYRKRMPKIEKSSLGKLCSTERLKQVSETDFVELRKYSDGTAIIYIQYYEPKVKYRLEESRPIVKIEYKIKDCSFFKNKTALENAIDKIECVKTPQGSHSQLYLVARQIKEPTAKNGTSHYQINNKAFKKFLSDPNIRKVR